MSKKQILVVEDERIVAEDIKMSLMRLGYEACGIVHSGEASIIKAEEMHPDLVLMDIKLEGEMEGTEAAGIIHSRFGIPVVYLTAHSDGTTLERAKTTGPFGYILKPFEDKDLRTTVEIALFKHEMEMKLKESEEKYRGLAENAYDAIYISNLKGLQYVNPAFEKLAGWRKEELCSKEFNFWNTVHPDDIQLLLEREKSKQQGKKVSASSEFRIITKNKKIKTIEANSVNIRKNGELREIGILRDITDRKKAEEELKKSYDRLQKTFEDTVNALVSAIEIRDPYTAGHQKRVAHLASAIAWEMGLDEEVIEGLRRAGLVHDVGKIQIPAEILIKPTDLSENEFVMIEAHPQVGHEILNPIEFHYPIAQIVLQHHERLNGSGYPAGLRGDEILLDAKIIAVADVIEAMTSDRPYRQALTIEAALKEITKHKNILYDPEVVNACKKLFYIKSFSFDQPVESNT